MPRFSQTEKEICPLFTKGTTFLYAGKKYRVLSDASKPTIAKGECKTDVYFKAKVGNTTEEFKISVKQLNADFLENKMQYERAKEIFGNNADKILSTSILSIKDKFEEQPLVYFHRKGKTEAKCVKLGWKFELLNVLSGDLSGKMDLTNDQKLDVYSGTKLPFSKRNAIVNGEVVKDSGVANLIAIVDPDNLTRDSVVSALQPIQDYVRSGDSDVFFACKALNFRVAADKWDGNRPLAVCVRWNIVNGELEGQLDFSKPLQVRGDEIGDNVRELLGQLRINGSNFEQLEYKLMPDVKRVP